jgi:hypothetical protein
MSILFTGHLLKARGLPIQGYSTNCIRQLTNIRLLHWNVYIHCNFDSHYRYSPYFQVSYFSPALA